MPRRGRGLSPVVRGRGKESGLRRPRRRRRRRRRKGWARAACNGVDDGGNDGIEESGEALQLIIIMYIMEASRGRIIREKGKHYKKSMSRARSVT